MRILRVIARSILIENVLSLLHLSIESCYSARSVVMWPFASYPELSCGQLRQEYDYVIVGE